MYTAQSRKRTRNRVIFSKVRSLVYGKTHVGWIFEGDFNRASSWPSCHKGGVGWAISLWHRVNQDVVKTNKTSTIVVADAIVAKGEGLPSSTEISMLYTCCLGHHTQTCTGKITMTNTKLYEYYGDGSWVVKLTYMDLLASFCIDGPGRPLHI